MPVVTSTSMMVYVPLFLLAVAAVFQVAQAESSGPHPHLRRVPQADINATGFITELIHIRDACDAHWATERTTEANSIMYSSDAWSNTYMKKKSCQDIEIIFKAIINRAGKCKNEATRNRLESTAHAGLDVLKSKCMGVEMDQEASNYISCLSKVDTDDCTEEMAKLAEERDEYQSVGGNTHDVCCAYRSYESCTLDKLAGACGDKAKTRADLILEAVPSPHLKAFCSTYEQSVCDSAPSFASIGSTLALWSSALLIYFR